MGLRSVVRSLFEIPPAPVQESTSLEPEKIPERRGIEYGIPAAGTAGLSEQSTTLSRGERLDEMHDLYLGCSPVAVTVNAIARSVTAGGMVMVPDDASPDAPDPTPPGPVIRAKRLMRFTNPRENLIQLVRGACVDLEIFGDAYIEVSWLDEEPVALYSLDAPSMMVDADEHGQINDYKQFIPGRRDPVTFEPHEVIHLSLDNPRGGLYGLSPLLQVEVAARIWLFTAACLKETMRKGNPPRLHVDHPKDVREAVKRWLEQFMVRVLGPKNIGTPVITTGGAHVQELQPGRIDDYLKTMADMRDIISGTLGAPPNKVNIVESGNLGGGTGEAQDKNWRTETIIPLQTLVLEALNFQIVQRGFGIDGWHMEFVEVDYRDSKVVEDIHTQRVVHGRWTINRSRREIGEPPVAGGDDAFVMDRGKFVFVRDMARYSQAEIDQMEAPMVVATGAPTQTAPDGNAPPEPDSAPPTEALRLEFDRRYRAALLEPARHGGSNGRNGHSAP